MNFYKKIEYLILISLVLSCLGLWYTNISQTAENKRLKLNQKVLLSQTAEYKKTDSLNTCRIQALSLKINELEAYRAEDLALIKELNVKKKNLESIIKQQTVTVSNLQAKLRDSIRIDTLHAVIDTLKCFSYRSKWLDADGCIGDSLVDLNVISRDSLVTIESLVPKKLWFVPLPARIFGYKTRQVDILSKNPNTEIVGIEYVKIVL